MFTWLFRITHMLHYTALASGQRKLFAPVGLYFKHGFLTARPTTLAQQTIK